MGVLAGPVLVLAFPTEDFDGILELGGQSLVGGGGGSSIGDGTAKWLLARWLADLLWLLLVRHLLASRRSGGPELHFLLDLFGKGSVLSNWSTLGGSTGGGRTVLLFLLRAGVGHGDVSESEKWK